MWLGIGEAIEHWARYKPNKIALTVEEINYNFSTLYKRAVDVGIFFLKAGIQGRIGISVKDKFDFFACIAGLNLTGNSLIILSPCSDSEALKIHLVDTNPSAILANEDFLKSIPTEYNSKLQKIDILKITQSNEGIIKKNSCEEWGILFSSGSTGVPKAIVYNNISLISELLAWCLELGITGKTRFYIGRPVYYTGGLALALSTLLVGGEVVLPDQNKDADFEEIWKHYQNSLKKKHIDYTFFIPDQIRTFLKIAKDPIGGNNILIMGSPISGEEKKNAYEKLKSNIIESWGNSEGLGTITDIDDLFIRPTSIGRPFLTEKLYVVTEDLEKCKCNEIGRLAGAEETMFSEYANRPEATRKVKKNNLILSDDIGYMDENGYFYILGRAQETFVINGKTVVLTEMEGIIRNIPNVQNVCIVAKERQGAVSFFAVVVSNNKKKNDFIRNEIRKKLNLKISNVVFTDTLPRLTSGKIDRIKAEKLIINQNDAR